MANADPPAVPPGEKPKVPTNPAVPPPPVHRVTQKAPAPAAKAPSLDSLSPEEIDGPPPEGEEPQFHQAPGFFNQPWVQNVLPLATSLMLHIGLITLGILGYQVAKQIANPNKDQVIIPESKSIEKNAIPGGIPHPGLNNDPTRDAAQDVIKNSDNSGFTANVDSNINAAVGGQGDTEMGAGEGPNSANGKGSSAFAGGGGGGTAPWGVPGGGGGGLLPKSAFFGTGGNATKVVYLCDKSGSMLSVFGNLKQQLKESIGNLDVSSGQQFNVIFFSDEGPDALFKDGMQIASADNKAKALAYIDNEVAAGGTLPLPAIKMAIDEKPELLYVLTDGFDQIPSFDDVSNAFKAANAKMHINCIFLQSDEDPKLESFLRNIATTGHGEFKPIKKSDM